MSIDENIKPGFHEGFLQKDLLDPRFEVVVFEADFRLMYTVGFLQAEIEQGRVSTMTAAEINQKESELFAQPMIYHTPPERN